MKQVLCFAFCVWLSAHTALAQNVPQSKVYLALNGGYQLTKNNFADGAVKRENAEDGRFDTTYEIKAGPSFNIAGGANVRRQFGVGVGVNRISVASSSHLNGSIPHPFFFNRPRAVSGDVAGLTRDEFALHIQARVTVPVSRRLQVTGFAGPSLFRVTQGMVTDFSYSDSYPYDEATFRTAVTETRNASKIGFNVGADVGFFFSRQVGVGFSAQFSGASVPLKSAGGGTVDVKAGGAQLGGGLRLRL
jgi:hypothetical protein